MDKKKNKGKLEEELLEVVKMRDKMLMAISHELRTPLNAIYGFAELLALSKNLNDIELEYVKNIRESTRALNKIVDNITDYTKSTKGQAVLEDNEFTLLDVLEEVSTLVFMKAMDRGLQFAIWVDPTIPQKMWGDMKKINRVLMHLLLNSVEYTKQGMIALVIRKQIREDKLFLCYEVIDTGIGIRMENADTIFQVFARFEDEKTKTSGIGLGLTICQEYIKAMGGRLTCESTYGKGSCFSFCLETKVLDERPTVMLKNPEAIHILLIIKEVWRKQFIHKMCGALGICKAEFLEDVESIEKEHFTHIFIDSESEYAAQWLQKKIPYPCEKLLLMSGDKRSMEHMKSADRIFYRPFTIFMLAELLGRWNGDTDFKESKDTLFKTRKIKALVVDDNEMNLMIAANILRQYDMIVDEAESGTLAAKMYYNNKYDIILMDYLMPEMDGIETTKNLRKIDKGADNATIIALSANVTEEIKKGFLEAGAQEVLTKPLEIRELSRVIRKWMPEEKILDNQITSPVPEEEERNCKDAAKIALSAIEGLEWEAAIKRMNSSADNYMKLLGICRINIREQLQLVKNAVEIMNRRDMKLYFHSLKGIFVNIGAVLLAEKSSYLEQSAADFEEEKIRKNKDDYFRNILFFTEQLKKALALYANIITKDSVSSGQQKMSQEERKQKLLLLKEHISRFEFNEINELLEVLIVSASDDSKDILKAIMADIQTFRYDEALEKLKKME